MVSILYNPENSDEIIEASRLDAKIEQQNTGLLRLVPDLTDLPTNSLTSLFTPEESVAFERAFGKTIRAYKPTNTDSKLRQGDVVGMVTGFTADQMRNPAIMNQRKEDMVLVMSKLEKLGFGAIFVERYEGMTTDVNTANKLSSPIFDHRSVGHFVVAHPTLAFVGNIAKSVQENLHKYLGVKNAIMLDSLRIDKISEFDPVRLGNLFKKMRQLITEY